MALFVGGAAWGTPGPAHASSALILPRIGGSELSEAARAEALDALRRVLSNDGWTVHTLGEDGGPVPTAWTTCGPDDGCAHELRATFDTDVTVGLRAWGEGDRIEHVAVILGGVRGVGHRAVATVTEEAPLPFAIAEAARAAIHLFEVGEPPEGAMGTLEPNDEVEPATSWEASLLNGFLGGLFVAGSAPMLGYAINTAVRDGQCLTEGPTPDTCVQRVRFGDGAGLFLGLGLITLGTGIGILIAQPIRFHVMASPSASGVAVSGTF
ncbi:MAG: hypothetical protein AB7S26_31770 [Sandaracinaceae bacterium]